MADDTTNREQIRRRGSIPGAALGRAATAGGSQLWFGKQPVAHSLVRPVFVVMANELGGEVIQVPKPERQEVIQTLALDGAHPSFGEGVELRRAGGQALGHAAMLPQRGVEGRPELPVAIAEQDAGPSEHPPLAVVTNGWAWVPPVPGLSGSRTCRETLGVTPSSAPSASEPGAHQSRNVALFFDALPVFKTGAFDHSATPPGVNAMVGAGCREWGGAALEAGLAVFCVENAGCGASRLLGVAEVAART